jgi:hypothetical protein
VALELQAKDFPAAAALDLMTTAKIRTMVVVEAVLVVRD